MALDLDVSSARINVASLQELLKARKRESERAAAPPADRRLRVEAELRLRAAAVTFPSHTAEAVAMILSMAEGRTAADVEQATVCGIGLKGTMQVSGPVRPEQREWKGVRPAPVATTGDPVRAARRIMTDDGFNIGVLYAGDRPAFRGYPAAPTCAPADLEKEFEP